MKFWKMTGAGNDFVLLAGLPRGRTGPALARALCDRRRGIGADGLLAVTRRRGTLNVDYWNADGSAAFCGNGLRCATVWAAQRGWPIGSARVTGRGRAEIDMPAPKYLRRLSPKAHLVNTGVPHVVIFVENIEKAPVETLGPALRKKMNANVDFVQAKKDLFLVRTYERGVEGETLACGTGAMAAVFAAGRSSGTVRTRGGDILRVNGARLEGPARIVFIGDAHGI